MTATNPQASRIVETATPQGAPPHPQLHPAFLPTPRWNAGALIDRIRREPGGSVFLAKAAEPRGCIVSVTNNVVSEGLAPSLERVRRFAALLSQLNPDIADDIVLGWYRNPAGRLFVDAGLVLGSVHIGRAVGVAFAQEAIACLDGSSVRVIALRHGAPVAEPVHPAAPPERRLAM